MTGVTQLKMISQDAISYGAVLDDLFMRYRAGWYGSLLVRGIGYDNICFHVIQYSFTSIWYWNIIRRYTRVIPQPPVLIVMFIWSVWIAPSVISHLILIQIWDKSPGTAVGQYKTQPSRTLTSAFPCDCIEYHSTSSSCIRVLSSTNGLFR
jgi:hypothetical protein